MAKLLKSVFAAVLLPACVAGCTGVQAGTEQGKFRAGRGLFGPYIETSADATGEIVGLEANKDTGDIKIERVTLGLSPSITNPTIPPIIDAKTRFQTSWWEGANTNPIAIGAGNLLTSAGVAIEQLPPTLGNMVAARAQAKIAESQTRGAVVADLAKTALLWRTGLGGADPEGLVRNGLVPKDILDESKATFPKAFEPEPPP